MKNLSVAFCFFLLFFTYSCEKNQHLDDLNIASTENEATARGSKKVRERVVVANRVSRDITVIDAANNTVLNTYDMPDNGEPMYVVHVKSAHAVFVGDRANNRVVAFDDKDFSVKGTAPAGAGVFHMWASRSGNRLWVNNDIDNTTTVINPNSMSVKGTAITPPDLVAQGGKPHDVFVDPSGKFAYVSVIVGASDVDYVVKYSSQNYEEVDRVAVGKDPHLSATSANNYLYVPCANGVNVVDRNTMDLLEVISFAGSHGAGMSNSGSYFYSAAISVSDIATINTQTNSIMGTPITAEVDRAHNLAINAADSKLFVTHSSGTLDQLTIYDLSPEPSFSEALTVGTNPFGLAYYTVKGGPF